jgi:hypothetical protein
MGMRTPITGSAIIQNLDIPWLGLMQVQVHIIMGRKDIQGIRMVVRGPHALEVHSLHGPTCDEILNWLQVVTHEISS